MHRIGKDATTASHVPHSTAIMCLPNRAPSLWKKDPHHTTQPTVAFCFDDVSRSDFC